MPRRPTEESECAVASGRSKYDSCIYHCPSTKTDFVKKDPNGVVPDISIITSLANKADAATTNASLALKADSSYVDTQLATKADATATTNALASKADATATTNALALKADATATTNALASKADATATTNALAAKAPLASPSFTGNVTIAAPIIAPTSYASVPSSTQIGYVYSPTVTGSASISSGTFYVLSDFTLTPGVRMITGIVCYQAGSGSVPATQIWAGIYDYAATVVNQTINIYL